MTAEEAFADAREAASTLKRFGNKDAAAAMEAVLDALVEPLREYLTWHDEAGAVLLSEKPAGYFKSRFKEWEARDLARNGGRGRRLYREVVIPKPRRFADIGVDAEETARMDVA